MSDPAVSSDSQFRAKLGGRLVMGSSIGVILLGAIVIGAAAWTQLYDTNGKNPTALKDAAQLIFTSVLPLLGTWVGTVLAFYFTKESLEAASRTTLDAVRTVAQKLASTSVSSAMIKRDDIIKIQIPTGKTVGDLTLKEIDDLFDKSLPSGQKISRLPILNDSGAGAGIIHRSIWMEMRVKGSEQSTPTKIDSDTLAKLLPETSSTGKTFNEVITGTLAYIAIDRTLADAKAAMSALSLCQDVIVTQTGKSSEPMLGWIPNVDIARLSQA